MAGFGEELKGARKARGMSQAALAEAIGVTQGAIAHWETGRSTRVDYHTLGRLETALGLGSGELARWLPEDHPARRMAAVELPVLGVVAAGAGRDEPADPGEVLRTSEMWAGCVCYRVRGESMIADQIREGDYLVVRPVADQVPRAGDVVVAWIDGQGHAVKRLDARGYLRSGGRERWSHKLNDADQVLGVLVGVVRVTR
jgi:repressor LexA